MMHVDPTGHEPSHILPASELIPKLREVLAYMSRAIGDYIRGQSRELGPDAQNSLDFRVQHSMCQARDLLLRSRGRTSADIQLYPFALQGLQDAARLFRLDMEANDFWTKFGGTALATEETIAELEHILEDLDTWKGNEKADEAPTVPTEPSRPGRKAGTKSEVPSRVPSAEQLDYVLERLLLFNSGLRYEYRGTRLQKEDVMPRFEGIADALAAIEPALDATSGGGPDWWESEAVPVLKDVVTWLRAVAADWGWEPYSTPSLRQATKEERRERFREEYERPIDEAAMVWFRDDRANCPGDAWELRQTRTEGRIRAGNDSRRSEKSVRSALSLV